jgi:hypothetical protein
LLQQRAGSPEKAWIVVDDQAAQRHDFTLGAGRRGGIAGSRQPTMPRNPNGIRACAAPGVVPTVHGGSWMAGHGGRGPR